jgi:hypothetical protein
MLDAGIARSPRDYKDAASLFIKAAFAEKR